MYQSAVRGTEFVLRDKFEEQGLAIYVEFTGKGRVVVHAVVKDSTPDDVRHLTIEGLRQGGLPFENVTVSPCAQQPLPSVGSLGCVAVHIS